MLEVLSEGRGRQDVRIIVWHERLPLLATVGGDPDEVTIWSTERDGLQALGCVGDRTGETPRMLGSYRLPSSRTRLDWHPIEPLLALAVPGRAIELWHIKDGGLSRGWSATGEARSRAGAEVDVEAPVHGVKGSPASHAPDPWHAVAFTSDGGMLWVSPGPDAEESALVSVVESGRPPGALFLVDTVVARHPEHDGGLLAALQSDQGATVLRFVTVRPDGVAVPWKRALILQADGYDNLAFSSRGDKLMYTGNAYESGVWVHDFPSLRRALYLELPAAPVARPGAACAFTPDGEGLLVGLPTGEVAEVALREDAELVGRYPVANGAIDAVGVQAHSARLVVASGARLLLLSLPHTRVAHRSGEAITAAFGAPTSVVPPMTDADGLDLTDGVRDWHPASLTPETLPPRAPMWAALRAHLNQRR